MASLTVVDISLLDEIVRLAVHDQCTAGPGS